MFFEWRMKRIILIDGTIKFDVTEDMKLKCKLYCKGDQIKIEQMQEVNPPISTDELGDKKYKEIKQAFEEAGFTNIEKKVIKDLTEDKLNEKNIVSTIKNRRCFIIYNR